MKRNLNFKALKASYLFPEIHARRTKFAKEHPELELISLGIGDTTLSIPPFITSALMQASQELGTDEGYRGYGPEQGISPLKEAIATKIYQTRVSPDEVFISDGAKCDLGRLQMLFGKDISIAVQDPTYPVYVDGSLIQGVKSIQFMPCTPENDFFPHLNQLKACDLIYFCSPNNPTGTVATFAQLKALVEYAIENRSIIIFDSAYSHFIQDPSLPRSIYEIPHAKKVAIEVGSFSKIAGFTGVRLGWTIVPEELKFDDGSSVRDDWNRLTTTLFNGASCISQKGGLAVLEEAGISQVKQLTHYYLENAKILKGALTKYEVYGGTHAPYLWVRFPKQNSWDVFEHFLTHYQLVITPGSGFGAAGEEFIRMTAFGKREAVLKAAARMA